MYAEFATSRLIDFLRASSSYNLEMVRSQTLLHFPSDLTPCPLRFGQAYKVCQERDLVPEMVFLLGRMGNNKKALTLIIERLGDVHRAIDFAKEQSDDDLWEDLLKYSETRPGQFRLNTLSSFTFRLPPLSFCVFFFLQHSSEVYLKTLVWRSVRFV